ncbi:MAG: hypothetical protein U0324_14990 [Polyangiales bacterium]
MTTRPSHAALAFALAAFAAAPGAFAQAHPLRLSLDRAFGVGYTSATTSSSITVGGATVTRESTTTGVGLSLLGVGYNSVSPSAVLVAVVPVHQPPRLALDYELASHLTLGASAFFSYGQATDADGDGASAFGFGVAPRVGYSLALGDRLILWPRVGVSFSYASASPIRSGTSTVTTSSSTSYTSLSLNVEPTAVFMLASQFGLTAGVVVDVPLVGSVTTTSTVMSGSTRTETTTDGTLKLLYFGLQFGVMGRF